MFQLVLQPGHLRYLQRRLADGRQMPFHAFRQCRIVRHKARIAPRKIVVQQTFQRGAGLFQHRGRRCRGETALQPLPAFQQLLDLLTNLRLLRFRCGGPHDQSEALLRNLPAQLRQRVTRRLLRDPGRNAHVAIDRHQQHILSRQRNVTRQKRALLARGFFLDLHQHILPAL